MKLVPLLMIAAAAIAGVQLTCAQIIAHSGAFYSGTNSVTGTSSNSTPAFALQATNYPKARLVPVLNLDQISPEHPLQPGIYQSEPYAILVKVPGTNDTADVMDCMPLPAASDLKIYNPALKLKPVAPPVK